MNLLILEGCDGAGKSTAAAEIAKLPDVLVTHWSAPKQKGGSAFQYWKDCISEAYRQVSAQPEIKYWIWDRSFLGNLIYGGRKDDQIYIDMDETLLLLKWVVQTFEGARFFLLRANFKTIKERLAARGESYVTPKESYSIQQQYEELFQDLRIWAKEEKLNLKFHTLPINIDRYKTVLLLNKYI